MEEEEIWTYGISIGAVGAERETMLPFRARTSLRMNLHSVVSARISNKRCQPGDLL